jgi:hypothetical protein
LQRFILAFIIVTVLVTSIALATPVAGPVAPAPFTATYTVSYRGFEAGRLTFALRAKEGGTFVYETSAQPGLLAKILIGDQAVERSVMRIDSDGVHPLSWYLNDGKPGDAKDGALTFSWEEQHVTGKMEGQVVQLPTEPGLQDRLSLQVAVLIALLRGHEPGTIAMIDHDKIKRYSYRRAGSEQIKAPAGKFDTVVYESTRPGSNRVSRVWHAPALGYIPVRAEQTRNGKVETVMELVQVERARR